jgi:hypothetical protein
MANFGPHSPRGLTFDFAFHHVKKVQITPAETCTNFLTRRIYLVDGNGERLCITLFSDNGSDDIQLELLEDDC